MDFLQTVMIYFYCTPKDIIYVNAIIDSYGNLGFMRTLDKKIFYCAIYSTKGVYKTALDILNALQKEGAGISDIKTEILDFKNKGNF